MNPSRAIPLVLVSLMILMEIYASRISRSEARTDDRGSFFAVWLLVAAGYWAAFSMWGARAPVGLPLGVWAVWVGAAVAAAGMALRIWSIATLGRYFTYVVKVSPEQKVVDTGPYRLIRHPSYAGGLLTGIGIGLSLRLGVAPLIIGATSVAGYWIRMAVEERALSEGIGEAYRAYMSRTKRLIPFVW
ncbi:isoprenylcysteine carboxylmethyltransferase family protein [Phenylobacterium sp.]|uniref:methyltransferase family protein n=1 Tax=Phenylobacterium sp. TaxID=1871053 RepID=UPI00120FFD8B|nr:isoprenylcysteine carboxylmethyltransferase family protein [Phenylobacterium sp.]THD64530.1 MAG: isoprenylcysteine carboxylmethyltransferase family protein [Phenylobacterium sp.]